MRKEAREQSETLEEKQSIIKALIKENSWFNGGKAKGQ